MKKLLSWALVIAMIISSFAFVYADGDAGTAATPTLPEGAPADAVLIGTLDELKAVASETNTEGKYYVLTADIDMKDAVWNTFIGTAANPFKGTFHGNNHAIRNFKMAVTGANKIGYAVFGYIDGNAVITNVGVENVKAEFTDNGPYYSGSAVAGLVGYMGGNSKVENCFSKNIVVDTKEPNTSSWSGFNGDQVSYAAGLIGTMTSGGTSVANCYSLGFEEVDDSASSEGGLIGGMGKGLFGSITNCYSNTHLTTVDTADLGKVVNCYAVITTGWSAYGNRPGKAVTDAVLKNSAADLGEAFIADIQAINDGYPMLAWEMNLTRLEGNGSEESPFLITDADTLAQVAGHRVTAGKYYKLENDIDLEGAKLASYIGSIDVPFEGTFDGNGHIIKNYMLSPAVSGMPSYLGIFAAIGGDAVVKNIGVVNVTVTPEGEWGYNSVVGGLVANMSGNAMVANSFARNVTFDDNGMDEYAVRIGGGLVGNIDGEAASVKNCYANGVEEINKNVGSLSGMVGTAVNFSTIINSYSDTTLTMVKDADLGKVKNSFYVLDDDGTAYLRAGTRIKADELAGKLETLGSAFVADTNSINNGYPIQKWEAGMTPDDVEPDSPAIARDATLKSISISKGTLTPAFSAETTEYTVTVDNDVEKISIEGKAKSNKATVTGNVTDLALTVGTPAVVTITVTSQDGSATKTYTITVTRKEYVAPIVPGEPITVSTVDDLKAIATAVAESDDGLDGVIYKLANDIDMGGIDWTEFSIGTPTAPFKGTFDGNGHIIKNFTITYPAQDAYVYFGLFGFTSGHSVIKNVGVENVTFKPEGSWAYKPYGGALVAKMTGSAKVESCYARNITYDKLDSSIVVEVGGGLIGATDGAGVVVKNCYVTGFNEINDMIASEGALIGVIFNASSIENCYADNHLSQLQPANMGLVKNSYCLNNTQWSSNGARPGTLITAEVMKTIAAELGEAFGNDGDNINNGYPVLAWEKGAVVPEQPAKVIEAVNADETEVSSVVLGKVDEEAYLIVALYNGNKLVGQKFITVTEAGTVDVNMAIDGATSVKVFVMNSQLKPLTEAKIVK